MREQTRYQPPQNELAEAAEQLRRLGKIWFENKSPIWGLPTGLPSLDHITGGIHDGELTVAGARTSHGKSALSSQIAFKTIEGILDREAIDETVVVVSPEMTGTQLLLRQASQMTNLNSRAIRRGSVSEREYEVWDGTVASLGSLEPIFKLHTVGLNMEEIYDLVAYYQQEQKVRLVVIDYIQKLPLRYERGESHTNALARAVHTAQNLAVQRMVPVFMLSQLRRPPNDEKGEADESVKPIIHDLMGTGGLEQAADNVLLLWTDVIRMRQQPGQRVPAQIEVAKNRNGEQGYVNMIFNPAITEFEERSGISRRQVEF